MNRKDAHDEYNAKYAKDSYSYFKQHGICVVCRQEKAAKGRTKCLLCLDKDSKRPRNRSPDFKNRMKEHGRQVYAQRRDNGLCTKCGRKVPDGKSTCPICRAKDRERRMRANRAAGKLSRNLFGNGIYCHLCGNPVETGGAKMCNACAEKSRNAIAYARSFKKAPNYFERTNDAYWRIRHATRL